MTIERLDSMSIRERVAFIEKMEDMADTLGINIEWLMNDIQKKDRLIREYEKRAKK